MGVFCKLIFFVVTIAFAKLAYDISQSFQPPPIPELKETWWGAGDPKSEDKTIKPFKINVPDKVLNDLQQRLNNPRPFPKPLEGVQQNYGMNSKLLTTIVDYWKTKYNWRAREQFLNQFPQFTVSVQGLKLHYLHVKPENPQGLKVFPLLLLHGWPGSVREFYEIIPLLTKPQKGRDFVFEVIAPSLPGYGFSEGAVRPGLGAAQMAVVFKNFMERIGFKKYYVQGGDWGSLIVKNMAVLFPNNIIGMHSNMCGNRSPLANLKLFIGSFMPSLLVDKEHEDWLYPLSSKFSFIILETGYMHLQATKPDTIGTALNQSPIGLAAYILEKFSTWTNPEYKNLEDGGLTKKYTLDKLLDNVMIYWITESITTSARLYSETFNSAHMKLGLERIPVTVPSACARFKYDLFYTPTSILEEILPSLLQANDYVGGHFPAFELPEVLANDIYLFVENVLRLEKEKSKTKN